MRFTRIVVVLTVLSIILVSSSFAQKHIACGDRVSRGGNRLISVESEPGKQLRLHKAAPGKTIINLDGRKYEGDWHSAQTVTPFVDATGNKEETMVSVLFDEDNIYLFWEVFAEGGAEASVKENDMVITSDDYVQINLKPWLPDNIQYGRNYYYSIAVNCLGVVWDSYFDPYLDGYFFSSWDSNIQVTTSKEDNKWFAEMIIPFSGLDNYSEAGWKWNLEFLHARKKDQDTPARLYGPKVGVTVEQGVRVRRDDLVGYYWPRREFMQEVKPPKPEARGDSVSAAAIDDQPDSVLWSKAETIEVNRVDKTAEKIDANAAKTKVASSPGYLHFKLEADGAKIDRTADVETRVSDGMARQSANVNGVYIDTALFADECFWLLLQPRTESADNIHQDYYLITVDNHGGINGINYDKFGAPDRSWQPKADVDIYNTDKGWRAEVSIALRCFNLPPGCDKSWGFNVFRNRMLDKRRGQTSQLQAWLYTGVDFLNPEMLGTLTDVRINGVDDVRPAVEREIGNAEKKLSSYTGEYEKLTKQLAGKLDKLRLKTMKDLATAEDTLEQIDNTLGVIDAKRHYNSVSHPAKGGYVLFDVQFIGDKGWAVGAMGTVLRTEDDGKSWQSVELSTDADLYRVFFVNEREGWAVGGRIRMAEDNRLMRHDQRGGYGYIFHTRDGGKTWQCQYGERGRHLFGLCFIDKKTGFACGERGILLKTEDGGDNWTLYPTTGTIRWLYGITFTDKLNGFAVGESETVIRTGDGGKSWAKVDAAADCKFYGFRPFWRDVSFSGSTGCIVGHNGCIVISNDGGQTWQPAATFFDPKIREFLDLTRVQFVTEKLGYAVGELGTRVMVTEDGGASWSLRPVENKDWLRALWADSKGKLVLAGEREKILISNDKGYNWNTMHGANSKIDVLVALAHGDDSPIMLGAFLAHYGINEGRQIADVGVMRDCHSSEYEETYNLEHDRDVWMSGARISTNFDEFETGNNGCDYYHFTERLWEGEENVTRHIVAAIRAYRPDIVITHGGVYGDYDKPGHKVSGRAGLPAFETSGGAIDHWPQLTRLGLEPWQAKKLYCIASESYPPTLDLAPIGQLPLKGTNQNCGDWAEYVLRNFLSQGVHHYRKSKLCLMESLVPVLEDESSVFDGL